MKKIHLALIVVTALILICSLIYGGLYLYGHKSTLPKGTTLAGWEVGGLNISEVRSELQKKLPALEAVPLVLKVEGNSELTLNLKQAGMTYEAAAFERGLQDLTEGQLWDRVKALQLPPELES